MKYYKYSPIKSKEELFKAVRHIHFESHILCKNSFGKYLENSGNIGVFCHYDDEFEQLIDIRKEITAPSENPNQKYFKLLKPIIITKEGNTPKTIYTHLYIRRPDPYRHHVGDIDFYLERDKYNQLKNDLKKGKIIKGARIFDRSDLDMIELYNPDIDVLAYVSTDMMTKIVRVKQSEITKL